MRRIVTMLAFAGLVAALAFAAPITAKPDNGNSGQNKYPNDVARSADCTDEDDNVVGTITLTAPERMWPPNHKYQPATFVATATDPDDMVELATEGTHDEYLEDGSEMNGAGNTTDDVDPAADMDGPQSASATTSHSLRSERSGQGDGRTYTLSYEATFTDSDMDGANNDMPYGEVVCMGSFAAEVPHDMRGGADWK